MNKNEQEYTRRVVVRAVSRGKSLRYADLRYANLSYADLSGADLREANLRGADLREANLRGADLSGAKWNYNTIGIHEAPQGSLVVWGNKAGHIIKMRVPVKARRSLATTRKMRVEYARVLEIEGGIDCVEHAVYGHTTVYRVGKIVRPDSWDDNRWNECSNGIHCFLTREEAVAWN